MNLSCSAFSDPAVWSMQMESIQNSSVFFTFCRRHRAECALQVTGYDAPSIQMKSGGDRGVAHENVEESVVWNGIEHWSLSELALEAALMSRIGRAEKDRVILQFASISTT